MKYGKKQMLALLLAAAMILGGLPPVFAADGIESPWDVLDAGDTAGANNTSGSSLLTKQTGSSVEAGVANEYNGYFSIARGDTVLTTFENYCYIRPRTAPVLNSRAKFTFETSLRLGGYVRNKVVNDMSARVNGVGSFILYLVYGTQEQGGGIYTVSDRSDFVAVDTTVWHNYTMVVTKESKRFDIYVDGERKIAGAPSNGAAGTDLLRIGPGTGYRSDIEIAAMRLADGDISDKLSAYSDASVPAMQPTRLRDVTFSENTKTTAQEKEVTLNIRGVNYSAETPVSLTLYKASGTSGTATEITATGTITGESGTATVTMPNTLEAGEYYFVAEAGGSTVFSFPYTVTPVVPATISVDDFGDHQVIQRNVEMKNAQVSVSGSVLSGFGGDVQVRVAPFGGGEAVVDWQTVSSSVSEGPWSGVITVPQGGWYRIEARLVETGTTTEIGSIAGNTKWGVGMVVLCIGQSNMIGQGEAPYTIADDLVANFKGGTTWQHLQDPYDGAGGSLVPALGNKLVAALGIPVGFVPAADSGSGLHAPNNGHAATRYWMYQNTSNVWDTATLYGKAITRAKNAGGVELAVWNQGETDGAIYTTEEQYESDMRVLLERLRGDLGNDGLAIFLCQIGTHDENISNDAVYTGIRNAQHDLDDGENFFLAATEMEFERKDTAHYKQAGLDGIGRRVAQAILYSLGKETYYRGPAVVSAAYVDENRDTIDVTVAHRGGTDIAPANSITGFVVLDDYTAVVVVAAVRQNATTIRLTLAAAVSGSGSVRYLYGLNPDVSNIVKDNTAMALPLENTTLDILVDGDDPPQPLPQPDEAWDITEKYFDASWAVSPWSISGSTGTITAGADSINITKTSGSSYWALLNLGTNGTMTQAGDFTAEVRAKVGEVTGTVGNKIGVRWSNSKAAELYLGYGVEDGYVSTDRLGTGQNTYFLDTTVYHDYRIVINAATTAFSLYVDGVLVMKDIGVIAPGTSGGDILKIGAETNQTCNITAQWAKISSDAVPPSPAIPTIYQLALPAYEQYAEAEVSIDVTIATDAIADGTPVTAELVDSDKAPLSSPVSATGSIASGAATVELTIPATVLPGTYYVRVTAGDASRLSPAYQIVEPIRDYLITAGASPNGSINPSGSVKVTPETDQAFTITADAGYKIARVTVDGIAVDLQGATEIFTHTFTAVAAEHAIQATFVAEGVTVEAEMWDTIKHFGIGAVTDGGWRWIPGGQLEAGGYTQKFGYVNIAKSDAASAGKYAWIGTPSTQNFPDNTGAFTTEALVRVNAPEEGNENASVNKISVRADNNRFYEIYISYGVEDGFVMLPDTDRYYYLDTSVWHAYRIIVSEDHLTYSLYVDGALAFRDVPAYDNSGRLTAGADLYKFGAEAWEVCNMDILSAKIANRALIPNPQIPTIVSVEFDARMQEMGTEGALTVTVSTNIVPDGTAFTAELVDKQYQSLDPAITVSGIIENDEGVVTLTIPAAQAARGTYYVKITTDAVANSPFRTYNYRIVSPLGETPVFPSFVPLANTIEMEDYIYNITNEFNFPSIVDTKDHPVENAFGDYRYYLFYAPHDAPAGICVAGSDSLDGPWTEYAGNPVVGKDWLPYYSVSHVSAGDVVWIAEQNCYVMYYHGENHTGRYATSTDLIHWTYGGVTFLATHFASSGDECSYGKVFAHTIPGLGNKYIQLLMVKDSSGIRKIYWAHSTDGIHWTPVKEPLVTPDPSKAVPGVEVEYHNTTGVSMGGRNLSGAFWMPWEDSTGTMRYYVIAHASSGNMYIFEVGEELDMEVHWGIFYDSNDDSEDPHDLDGGRSGAPYFIQDDEGVWHMFYEGGKRLRNNIVHAVESTRQYKIAVTISGEGGTVTPAANTDGDVLVYVTEDQEFVIAANVGYEITSLKVDGLAVSVTDSANMSYTFERVVRDGSIEVTFAEDGTGPATHTITATAGANGTIAPSGAVEVTEGAAQVFDITPDNGYVVATLTVDDGAVTPVTSYTFQNVSADHTIAVTFEAAPTEVWTVTNTFPADYADPVVTGKWRLSKGSNVSSDYAIGPGEGLLHVQKDLTYTGLGNAWAISPANFVISPNAAFSMESRIKLQPPADSAAQGNKIGIRIDDTAANNGADAGDLFIELLIMYGEKDGYVTLATEDNKGEDGRYPLDTTVWHDYRIVVNTDRTYAVYIDGALALTGAAHVGRGPNQGRTGGADLLKFGAESWNVCNMDIAWVRYAESVITPNPVEAGIREIALSEHTFYGGETIALGVTLKTGGVEEQTPFTAELLDAEYASLGTPVTAAGTIEGNSGTVTLNLPADLPLGAYYVKATVSGATNSPVWSQSITLIEPLGEPPVFPNFVPTGYTIEMAEYIYQPPSNEYNFPSIVDTRDHPVNNVFGDNTYRYYLFYAPHNNPGGICVAASNSLDGPWTEYGSNPVVRNVWPKDDGSGENHYSVSHVSAGDVVWIEEQNCYVMYYHGENPTGRYATSTDLINWTYGGVTFTAGQFASGCNECSYGKVFEYEVPGLGNKYIQLLMISYGGERKIAWAHSVDGINWTPVTTTLIFPDPSKAVPGVEVEYHNTTGVSVSGRNLSGPFWMPWEDSTGTMRYYVIAHASSGNMYIFEVGEKLDKEIHWGIFYDSNDSSVSETEDDPADDPYNFDGGRAAAPTFMQDADGVWHMFYEGGVRLKYNIVHAVEDTKQYTITATAGTGGTISPSGAVPVTVLGDQTFTITPEAGYVIDTITVDGEAVSVDTGYTFTRVIRDATIEVTFQPTTQPITHTITATAGANGTISPAGEVLVAEGEGQTFIITPEGGYEVSTLTVDGSAVTPALSYTFENVTSDHTIAVEFAPEAVPTVEHTITATAGANGTISPAGEVLVAEGEDQTFTIAPKNGYQISTLTVDGSSVTPALSYTFQNVTADHTIAVTFKAVSTGTWTPDPVPVDPMIGPDEVIEAENETVEIALTEIKTTLSDEAEAKAVELNESKPIYISGVGLSVVIPAGTLSRGADLNAMLVSPSGAEDGNVIQVTLPDGTVQLVAFSVVGSGMAAYIATVAGNYEIVYHDKVFTDEDSIPDWADGAVDFAAAREFFRGNEKGEFDGTAFMSRNMIITVLGRIGGAPEAQTSEQIFADDVPDWAAPYVAWGAELGIVQGYDGQFRGDDNITREQLCVMLSRLVTALDLPVHVPESGEEPVISGASDWAQDAVSLMVRLGVLQGDEVGALNLQDVATRYEVAVILERFVHVILGIN